MAEYLELERVLDDKNIITVQTKEYGSIDVIPVDTITDIELSDVQAVVHCKDCIYLNRHDCPMAYIEHQTLQFAEVKPNFFCAAGRLTEEDINDEH